MTSYLTAAILLFLITEVLCRSTVSYKTRNLLQTDSDQWAGAAFEFVHNMTCQDVFLTTEEDCKQLVAVHKSKMNFYSAVAGPAEKLMAVLPDGPLSKGAHDALIALDPYPEANLGHLLVVFFIDLGWSQLQCEVNGGHFLGDGTCMSLALRKRCHNMLQESKWKLKFLTKQYRNKQCEINFFPLVHLAGETASQKKQMLQCREDIEGFAPCPVLRAEMYTESLVCDPIETNTRSCIVSGSGSDPTVTTRCRLFERCDHALLLTGGWDRLTDRPLYMDNMLAVHGLLKDNGFPEGNIKMFYSNGHTGLNDLETDNLEFYPSVLKLPLRYHLRKICQSLHCADSLVLYLTGPTTNDGSMLLWDVDGNGQADENELYSVKELLFDIRDCAAQQVYLVADHSYAGMLVHALEGSTRHENVVAFASGRDHQYSWGGEFTRYWKSFASGLKRTDVCVKKSFEDVQDQMSSSSPISYDGSNGTISTTLFGAPCDVRPPFSEHELRKDYLGCQNLPTSVWMRRRRIFEGEEE